jgi:hypothetical protein
MGPRRLLQGGCLLLLLPVGLLCLLCLCHQVGTLVLVVSVQVAVVINEVPIVVIAIVMLIVMLVGCTAGPPVL